MKHEKRLRISAQWMLSGIFLLGACSSNSPVEGVSDLSSSAPSDMQVSDGGTSSYPYTLSATGSAFLGSWGSGKLDCTMSAAAMAQSGAASVTFGNSTIYVGWSQVTSNNQDAFIARVTSGSVAWCMAAESQSPDGRAYGVAWNGGSLLYAVYSVDGGGTAFDGKGGWIPAYGTIGSGGGASVSVIAKHDPASGAIQRATFVPAQLSSTGKVNTLSPRGFTVTEDGSIEFLGTPSFAPLNPDKTRMCLAGSEYPSGYLARFPADLGTPLCAQTESCSQVKVRCR